MSKTFWYPSRLCRLVCICPISLRSRSQPAELAGVALSSGFCMREGPTTREPYLEVYPISEIISMNTRGNQNLEMYTYSLFMQSLLLLIIPSICTKLMPKLIIIKERYIEPQIIFFGKTPSKYSLGCSVERRSIEESVFSAEESTTNEGIEEGRQDKWILICLTPAALQTLKYSFPNFRVECEVRENMI